MTADRRKKADGGAYTAAEPPELIFEVLTAEGAEGSGWLPSRPAPSGR
jgi:hypothetical protein